MNDIDLTTQREVYLSALRIGLCTVTFTKVNGDTRVMKCTLSDNFIPMSDRVAPVASSTAQEIEPQGLSKEVIRVFDVEVNGWRSFRIDSVIDFQPS